MTSFPDRRYFGRVAEESGFRAGPLETVFRLAQLLGQIDERVDDELLLRGGTALNLFHLDVPRLSVDIDLDFVAAADAEQAQARRPELLAELEALARAAGYEVAQERASYAMAHLRLRDVRCHRRSVSPSSRASDAHATTTLHRPPEPGAPSRRAQRTTPSNALRAARHLRWLQRQRE